MNKKFLSAILFGALMVTSTGTFVSCKDYDDDIEQLSNEKDKLSQQIAELEKQVGDELKPELEALKNQLNSQGADLKAIQDALNALKKKLTSLVFIPEFYYGGIEAMTVKTYNYQSWTTEAVSADADNSQDAPEEGAQVEMAPKLTASYHVNPSTVTTDDILSVKFLAADKKYESVAEARSVEGVVVFGDATSVVEKGVLNVTAPVKDGSIKMEGDIVTVLAAQATLKQDGEEVTVTSDYAVVRSEVRTGFDLAIATLETEETIHLYGTAAEAIADQNDIRLQLVWNAEGFDIADTIRTHINGCEENLDVKANDGIAKREGFEYSYELVGWFSGDNKTSESAHAALNGSVIRPQMTADGKQQAFGAEQSKATIGRLPVVRVILTDVVSGNIAAVGYLPFEIVAEAPVEKQWEVAHIYNAPFGDEFTVNCENGTYEFPLKWHQVEEQIIAKLGISKDEFEGTYTLESNTEDADQFTATTVNATKVTAKTGVVSKTTTDIESSMTEVLMWSITENEAYQIFKAGKTSITVNVRFSNPDEKKYVYVSFTWTPDPLNITPNGEIEDANKIKEYWYAKNGAVAGEGYSDIHANVKQVISDNAADCTFNSDILNTLVGNVITVKSDATYPAFADEYLNKSVVFAPVQDHLAACEVEGHEDCYVVTGASGEVYEITVSSDGMTLYANILGETTSQAVVVLNENVMEYQETEYAKDILNNADHSQLADGETFTAKLMFDAYLCDEIEYTLNNKVFFAKYLRPVTANPADVEELVDAANGASEAALNLQLVDWRDKDFDKEEDTEGYNFYGFYGIESIEADITAATTDLNNGDLDDTLLSEVTNKVELAFVSPTDPITKGNHGKFTYLNNGTTLGKFTVRVPLTITYKWGKLYTSVDLIINKTINN